MKAILESCRIESLIVRPQVREHFDQQCITELAASISETGLQQPLLARMEQGQAILIDGERRLRAVSQLGWSEVPVLVLRDPVSIAEAVARQLACNCQRVDLNMVERAKGIAFLMKEGAMTAENVARKLGASPAQVTKTLSVLKLPANLQAEVVAGRLPADSAYQLSRLEDPVQQAALAAEVLGNRLSRDALSRKLKALGRRDSNRINTPSRVTAMLGANRTLTLAGKGLTIDTVVEWLEAFLGRARKAKLQGLTLETFVRALRDQAAERKGARP